jgi:tryptophan synthase alpha chain
VTKLLMPYLTAGVGPDWASYLTAFEDAGADLIEVGLPFSDPTVDGATIQEASDRALRRGASPAAVLAELARRDAGVPLIASTYANIALRPGFAPRCARPGSPG